MFHKEGSFTKTQGKRAKDVPLKKSDRRKLRDAFLSMISNAHRGDEQEEDEASTKGSLKNLADGIFLDWKCDISLRKLKLKDAKSNAGATSIYIRAPSSGNASSSSSTRSDHAWPYTLSNQVLFISIGNVMLPSLALLSVLSVEILNTLPTVTVHAQVSKYLCRGADLMRSGIISMNDKNCRWVSIRAYNNPQPFAIGFVTKGTDANTIGAGTKGVGVEIIHCYGDEIYSEQSPSKSNLSDGAISEIGGQIFDEGNYGNVGFIDGKIVYGLMKTEAEQDEEDEDVANNQETVDNGIEKLSLDEASIPHDNNEASTLDSEQANNDTLENDDQGGNNDHEDKDDDEEEDDPEEALMYAFHNALVNISKSELPMAVSTFYSQHVLPARKEGTYIDLKATRYKKIGQFLMVQAHSGLITIGPSKDGKNPVAFVKSVDRSHIELKDARKRKKKAMEEDDGSGVGGNKKKTKIVVATLYAIPKNIVDLMNLDQDDVRATKAKSKERRGTGYLTAPECRDILNRYILSNQLVDELDPENVTLDGPLCDAVFRKSKKQIAREGMERNVYQEYVTRKELNTKWLACMDRAHAMVAMPGSKIISMKRGTPPMVVVDVERNKNRKNKFVTRVRNLEEVSFFNFSTTSLIKHYTYEIFDSYDHLMIHSMIEKNLTTKHFFWHHCILSYYSILSIPQSLLVT